MVLIFMNQLLIYYQCANPTIIVRQHDQGASSDIVSNGQKVLYTQKIKGAFEGAEGVIGAFSSFSYQQSYHN